MTSVFGWALKLLLGTVLLWAGIAKMADPVTFATEISNYRFLPGLAPYLASTLPGLEITLGVVLVLLGLRNSWMQAAAAVCASLMAVFTVAVIQVQARGIDIECGCFGSGTGPVTTWTVIRDLLLVAASVALWGVARRVQRASR